MRAIRTDLLTPMTMPQSQTDLHHIYNGLDCCVTIEVLEALIPQLDPIARGTYDLSLSLQAPVLEMNIRGVLVDEEERSRVLAAYEADLARLDRNLTRLLAEGLGMRLNWRSPLQLRGLFYEVLGIPEIKKKGKVTVDEAALERLRSYFYAKPFVTHLLAMRDLGKKIGVLRTGIDPDGRIHTSYNIAGTETGRFSSSLSDFGSGTNLQNIEKRLRGIFVADPGYKFAYIDLRQAESYAVGAIIWNLFGDARYLDACESGDLHTTVCRMAFPTLFEWTGILRSDKALAEGRKLFGDKTYRDGAKVLGHGSNYEGKPPTMALHTHFPVQTVKEFQSAYFAAFPGIPRWHEHVGIQLITKGNLVTMLGRRRWFFGRRDEAKTRREAIAYEPQSMVAEILNRGMLQVWRANICQLLLQVHDAILIQYPTDQEDQIIPQITDLLKYPIPLNGNRTLCIPSEAQIGWNWGNFSPSNPDGLTEYRGHDDRTRSRWPKTGLLDRRVF